MKILARSPAPARTGKTPAIEVWASGDRMFNDVGIALTVLPGPDNGLQWLGLRNGTSSQAHQAMGIERDLATVDGATCTLTLDYAGSPGLVATATAIGIHLDGVRIATHAGVSTRRERVWQSLSFQFGGNGQVRRLAIVLEGGTAPATSVATMRGAPIDDVRVVETLPARADVVYGLADSPAALPVVRLAPTDRTGTEALSLVLEGLAQGSVLSDGTRNVVITTTGLAPELTGWALDRLQLLPPAGFVGDMALTLRATSTEPGNGASAGVRVGFTLRVLTGMAAVTPVTLKGYATPPPHRRTKWPWRRNVPGRSATPG